METTCFDYVDIKSAPERHLGVVLAKLVCQKPAMEGPSVTDPFWSRFCLECFT